MLKPVAGAATMRTSVVASVAELAARGAEYRREQTKQRTFVLEEYVGGDEWVADGVLFDGELLFCSLGTYADPCVSAVGGTLPLSIRRFDPDQDTASFDLALPVVSRSLSALGLRDGVFHMELFHDPATGRADVQRVRRAARRGAGPRGAAGEVRGEPRRERGVVRGAAAPGARGQGRPPGDRRRLPHGPPRHAVEVPEPGRAHRPPGRAVRARGEAVRQPHRRRASRGTNTRIAQCLVAADTVAAFHERLAEVRAWFDDRLVVMPDKARNRELRAWQRDNWPESGHADSVWT